MAPIRLLIVDAHPVFRQGLVSLLQGEADLQVAGQVTRGDEALRFSSELQPDVILMNARIPGMDSAEATRHLLEKTPRARILLLTAYGQDEHLLAALEAGAHGYVPKDADAGTFLAAIRQVYTDGVESAPTGRHQEGSISMPTRAMRTSLLERLVGALPVPYALSAAVFATLFGPPGTVALGLLATGNLAATVDLYFGGLPPPATWLQATAILVWWLTYFAIFWTVRWERLAIAREDEPLTRVLPAGVSAPWATRNRNATWPAALVAVVLTVVSWPFVIVVLEGLADAQAPALALIWVAQNVLRLGPFFLGLGTLFWLTAASLLGLVWLGRQPLELVPLEDDALLGLRPAGSMALTLASAYFGIVSLLAIQLALAPAIGPFGPALAMSVVFGVGLFFAPLWGLHRKMLATKKARQAEVRGRLLRLAFATNPPPRPQRQPARPGDPATIADLAHLNDSLARATEVLALEAAGRKVDASATWPFDLAILQRLGGAVMLPVVIALLTELVRRVLGL